VETKHADGKAGMKPRTKKATVLFIDRRKSTRPTMKREMERCNAASTARDDLDRPNMYASEPLGGAPRCRGISRISRDDGCAQATEMVMIRLSTKLRDNKALILIADAEGLYNIFP
jgi:hypothetical protein